jgi:DNA-binding MarR family transcriptional regulator
VATSAKPSRAASNGSAGPSAFEGLEQLDVLVHLAWAPSGTLPLHELTAFMVVADALSRSGITRLDRMDRDGLITRTVSTTDRRRFDVSLTPPGRLRFEQAWPAHADGSTATSSSP